MSGVLSSSSLSAASQLNQFQCKSLCLASKPSLFAPSSVNFAFTNPKNCSRSSILARKSGRAVRVRAEGEFSAEAATATEEPPKELTEVEVLKKKLVDSFYGTNRGLSATSETRAEIVELITQLEAMNPTPAPTEALSLLDGKWILSYTSFSGLFPLLSRGSLPLVKVEEISQTIDAYSFTVQNCVQFAGPYSTSSFTTNAKFEVRSPKRVQIKFEEGIIGTPQLTDSIVLPENVELFGQSVDLSPFKGLFTSVQDTASSVAKTISSQPPIKFNIPARNAESWLLTTYLDEEIRISRGDAGSVFVLIKEGSPLLLP
ncbi:hypothetical protein ACET3Z_028914 [Daucus carota]